MSDQTAGPFSAPEPTTAQILGQYARDLEAEGFSADLIRSLVRRMASRFDLDDLRVSRRQGKCGCCKCNGGQS